MAQRGRPRKMANIFNPPKSNVQFNEGQKSKGILDDYAQRKTIATQQIASGARVMGDIEVLGTLSGGNVAGTGGSHWTSGATALWPSSTLDVSGQNIITMSGAIAANATNITANTTSGATVLDLHQDLSGAYYTHETVSDNISGALVHLSGAYVTHAADASDPHGATLTQTTANVTNLQNTGDHTTSGAAYCMGLITSTAATPPTASNFPRGTIYLQYTA